MRREPKATTANVWAIIISTRSPSARRLPMRSKKQVSFLDVKAAPARSTYEFNNGWLATNEAASAASVLKFSTSRAGGLGDQLPAGTMRVYMRDKRGDPQFIGESMIEATPMGSQMSIRTGDAFDVKVKTIVVERTRISSSRWKTKMQYELTNARNNPITVDLGQNGLWAMFASPNKARRQAGFADRVEWSIAVPANGKATLTATFDSRY